EWALTHGAKTRRIVLAGGLIALGLIVPSRAAATVTATGSLQNGGALVVTSDGGSDQITVVYGTDGSVKVNGADSSRSSLPCALVSSTNFNRGGGNATIASTAGTPG